MRLRCWLLPLLTLAACPGESARVLPDVGGENTIVFDTGAGDSKKGDQGPLPDQAPGDTAIPKDKAVDTKPPPPPPDTGLPDWSGTSDIGKPCSGNSQCQYGLCAQNTHTGLWFCTKQCDRCDPDPCPSGSGCQNAGLMYICAPGYPNAPCP